MRETTGAGALMHSHIYDICSWVALEGLVHRGRAGSLPY